MKGVQFLLLIVASVLTAANPTDDDVSVPTATNSTTNDGVTSKCINETIAIKEISKAAKDLCDLLQQCLPFSRPTDCEEVRLNGNTTSGVYTIWPKGWRAEGNSVEVYCDMTTDGGGWTVLQRRGQYGNVQNYFNRTWDIYKHGFGELEKEFWIGNYIIFALTNQGPYSVRFDMRLVNGTSAYALYDKFWIEDEYRKYQLNIVGYSGNAGDSMTSEHHGMKFSTWDNDNDRHSTINCAAWCTGGWWFNNWGSANLNGLNMKGKYVAIPYRIGITWKSFVEIDNSLEFSEIKIKPRYFR